MKKIETIKNGVGGIDLMVEKDAGNPVLITTGKTERSIEFWKNIKSAAEEAISVLEDTEGA